MKNNWTVRLAVFTFVCFGLAAMFAKIAGEDKVTHYWQSVADALTDRGNFVSVYNKESFTAPDLKEINIVTEAIDVKIEKSKDEKIHIFYYKKNGEVADHVISHEDSVTKIRLDKLFFPKNNLKFNFNFKNMDYMGIKLQDVKESAAIIQVPINIKKIKIKTISGKIKIVDIDLDEVLIDSVSGDLELQGRIRSVEPKTVSGDLKFISDLSSPELKFSTTSGDADIVFMNDPDANFIFKSISGEIKFWGGLPVIKMDGDIEGFKLGKGTGQLKFKTISGDVKISHEID